MTELKNTINAKVFQTMAAAQIAAIDLKNKMKMKLASNDGAITDYAGEIAIGATLLGILLYIVVNILKVDVANGLKSAFKDFFSAK